MTGKRLALLIGFLLAWCGLMQWWGRHVSGWWALFVTPAVAFSGSLYLSWRVILAGRTTFPEFLLSIPQGLAWSWRVMFCRHKERAVFVLRHSEGGHRVSICAKCGWIKHELI